MSLSMGAKKEAYSLRSVFFRLSFFFWNASSPEVGDDEDAVGKDEEGEEDAEDEEEEDDRKVMRGWREEGEQEEGGRK